MVKRFDDQSAIEAKPVTETYAVSQSRANGDDVLVDGGIARRGQ